MGRRVAVVKRATDGAAPAGHRRVAVVKRGGAAPVEKSSEEAQADWHDFTTEAAAHGESAAPAPYPPFALLPRPLPSPPPGHFHATAAQARRRRG